MSCTFCRNASPLGPTTTIPPGVNRQWASHERDEFVSHSKSEERRTRGQDSSLINLNRICFLSQSIWYGLRMDQNTSSVQKGQGFNLRYTPLYSSKLYLRPTLRKICKPRTQEQIWSQPFCWSVSCCIYPAYELMNPAQTTSRSSFSDSSSEDCLQSSKYVQCSCRPSTEGITGTSCEWLWPWLQYYIISNMIISYIFIYHHTYVVYCMQMYAIGSLIIWVSQLQANTVDASRVLRPPNILCEGPYLNLACWQLRTPYSLFLETALLLHKSAQIDSQTHMGDDAPYNI